ncbi:MAG: SIMPL domain-containing protein [Atopobiaceae bacterium]|nr:SIMPL domain-containing protein [Atopobiaceae bacterium]
MDDSRLLSIGVSLERSFPVDVLNVNVSIHGRRDTENECVEAYNSHLDDVREALSCAGIPTDGIRNSDFNVYAHTEQLFVKDGGGYYVATTELRGYEFNAHVDAECPASTELAKRIWKALVGCGDEVEFSLGFGLKDEDAARSALLEEAVGEGRRRAEILAHSAGAEVTGIHSIEYEYGEGNRFGRNRLFAMAKDSAAGSAPSFNPADATVDCTVRMQWRMELL